MTKLDGDFWSNTQAEKIHLKQELYPELLNKSELALLQLQFWTLDELLLSNSFVKWQKLWIKLL